MRWLAENRRILEETHPGKVVAVEGDHLVAVADTVKEVREQARRLGFLDPLVSGVKSKDSQGALFIRDARLS